MFYVCLYQYIKEPQSLEHNLSSFSVCSNYATGAKNGPDLGFQGLLVVCFCVLKKNIWLFKLGTPNKYLDSYPNFVKNWGRWDVFIFYFSDSALKTEQC